MRKRFIFCILAFCAAAVASAVNPIYNMLLDDIDKAVAEKQWLLADSLTCRAMSIDPTDPSNVLLLSNLGMIRYYSGRDSLALVALDAAHAMAPNAVTVLANRATVLSSIGKIPEAIADYDCIEKIDSTYTDTYFNRGVIRLYQGDYAAAENDFKRLEKLAPDSEDTLLALATFYSMTLQPLLALDYYNPLIKKNPQAEYYAGRAFCELALDRDLEASDDIALGLELDAEYPDLYIARAILNRKRYEPDAAKADAARALSLGASPERVKAAL